MKTSLPIDSILNEFSKAFREQSCVIVCAEPGAGKTTRLPAHISTLCEKQIWVLEPRRIAAIAAAHRIAEENNWSLGDDVGYQVRFENKSSSSTKILFLTEALLIKKLLNDSNLENVSCIVFDEFHERSIHLDLAIAAIKELQELGRPDLKIVVMSATLNAQVLSQYLNNASIIQSKGKIFPLKIVYEEKNQILQTHGEWVERIKKLVMKALNENIEGDILCFLPGKGEIERLQIALELVLPQATLCIPLHGQMSLQEQKKALFEIDGIRKVILATNIAESSLTVQGVRVVVDCGLSRILQQNLKSGFASLQLVRISKASATQRAGRAARLAPGTVYRAWCHADEHSMSAFEKPEIERIDLAEVVLLIAALNVGHPENFSWFEKPAKRSLQMAQEFLQHIGAVETNGKITALGQSLVELPVHPRIGKLLLLGKQKKISLFVCEVSALLSDEMRIPRFDSNYENDVMAQWHYFKSKEKSFVSQKISSIIEQFQLLIGEYKNIADIDEDLIEELFFDVYSDRICRRRQAQSSEAVMLGGRGVKLHSESSVKQSEFFLAIELTEGRDMGHATVFKAVGLSQKFVQKKLHSEAKLNSRLEWDTELQKFWFIEELEWKGMPLNSGLRRAAQKNEIQEKLLDIACEQWSEILSSNKLLQQWVLRVHFLNSQFHQSTWLDSAFIRQGLGLACFGEFSLSVLSSKDMVPYFEGLLSAEQKLMLKKECPSHWKVPTGNLYAIQYSETQGPQLEVRLQELFGLMQTPMIANVPLTLVILAPNFRPVQVTRDIYSFWKNTYTEVRKEMRTRYPKHSWPEDPFTALPVSKGRPRY